MFIQGQIYLRQLLHKQYGGQEQGGISTPKNYPFIMLFTGGQGAEFGYHDDWSSDGTFLYTGEGQVGNMIFLRGNRSIRDHIQDQKDLHLFKYVIPGNVRYIGQMVCSGYHIEHTKDRNQLLREVIIFELVPISLTDSIDMGLDIKSADFWNEEDLNSLRSKALASSVDSRNSTERITNIWVRSRSIKIYVIKRSKGFCEACGKRAPFDTTDGNPYLESHHIKRLSDGGPDDPNFVAALCPNCHRQAHFGKDANVLNEQLLIAVDRKENI